ncbi:hypothetical protein I2I11_09815 [Pontibacter sp. 172403-2]|uniref:hypothetical protein n=1 Tax=Pontibacter rufus TaxID=2791028 RepID=UPI0018AFD983|nr:hypothetical protein [Pontibacter sp. 172403-2]MBF9253587.1 hypothetical protein [Pontibacter sp. 172403-2]
MRLRKDIEIQRNEPHQGDFSLLGKRTPQEIARNIVHRTPEVPFILDGVTYDPTDINRFNGQALLFMPIVAADGSKWLQLFHDETSSVLAGYFQVRQIATILYPADFTLPGVSNPTPPGQPPGTSNPNDPPPINIGVGCGGITGIPCGQSQPPSQPPPQHHEPAPPVNWGQVQMFDDADYEGNWFWLAKDFMWTDLTRVSRGGWFGGDWNDAISSLASTNTSCIYCEHVNLEGSKLVLGPNNPVPHLSALGWNDRISSVLNFG